MKITHHPAPESLMSCSAGSMPEAFAAVMSSHMTMCPECQKTLAFMETIGTAMFDNLASTPVLKDAPVIALRSAEADAETPLRSGLSGAVPGPLVSVIGHDFDHLAWRRVSPGVSQYVIPLSKKGRGELRLVKVAPGQTLPEHAHNGSELTLVLRGSYRDGTGHYRAGDVADFFGEVAHSPIADPQDGCICLIATEGKLRFKGLFARILQPLTGF